MTIDERKDQVSQMCRRLLDGETLEDIAPEYGMTVGRAKRVINNINHPNPYRYHWISYPGIREYLNLCGMTVREFAELLGVNFGTLSGWLRGDYSMRLWSVREILKVTGLKFEDAFREGGRK